MIIFLVGFILFGTTQTVPQMFQQVFGYTAFQAGMALTLGGGGLLLVMPLAGRLAGRVDPRFLLIPALSAIALGIWHLSLLTTQATFDDLALARFYQMIALPFVFVTINTVAYVGLKPSQTGDASALLNVFRNVGGTVGIAVSQAILVVNTQTHQSRLTENINLLNPNLQQYISQAQTYGLDQTEALAVLSGELATQAAFLSYLDVFYFIAVFMACVIPLCLFLRPSRERPNHTIIE